MKPHGKRVGAQRTGMSAEDLQALQRMVSGALRDTMNAHGPVGPPDIGSATKRIVGTIAGNFCFRRLEPTHQPPKAKRRLALST